MYILHRQIHTQLDVHRNQNEYFAFNRCRLNQCYLEKEYFCVIKYNTLDQSLALRWRCCLLCARPQILSQANKGKKKIILCQCPIPVQQLVFKDSVKMHKYICNYSPQTLGSPREIRREIEIKHLTTLKLSSVTVTQAISMILL